MSTNPADILQAKMADFIRKAPVMAGRYAVAHFQDNIRKRGGVPVNGNLQKFTPRKFQEPGPKRTILLKSGNMADAIHIKYSSRGRVAIGIDQPSIKKYANLHQQGGTLTVTPKMKSFFWAMYYKASGSVQNTKSGKQSKSVKSQRFSAYADIWKAMALKRVGSRIVIPKREFMRLTPDIETGIIREFRYEMKKIIQSVQQRYT